MTQSIFNFFKKKEDVTVDYEITTDNTPIDKQMETLAHSGWQVEIKCEPQFMSDKLEYSARAYSKTLKGPTLWANATGKSLPETMDNLQEVIALQILQNNRK